MTLEKAVEIVEGLMSQGWIDISNGPEDDDEWEAFRVLLDHGMAFVGRPQERTPVGQSPNAPVITINGPVE